MALMFDQSVEVEFFTIWLPSLFSPDDTLLRVLIYGVNTVHLSVVYMALISFLQLREGELSLV